MLPEIAAEELVAAVDDVAAELLTECGVDRPPIDAIDVAARLGLAVAWDYRQRSRGRFVRVRGVPGRVERGLILLRPEPREERRQWAVAHEIGEHTAGRVFERLGICPRDAADDAHESVANRLAGALLLPAIWFAAAAEANGWDLLSLKRRFSTASHELLARRTLDFPPPAIVTILDQGDVTFRVSNLPGALRRSRPLSAALADGTLRKPLCHFHRPPSHRSSLAHPRARLAARSSARSWRLTIRKRWATWS